MIGVKLCDPYWCAETNPQLSSFWKNMFVRQISLFLSWQGNWFFAKMKTLIFLSNFQSTATHATCWGYCRSELIDWWYYFMLCRVCSPFAEWITNSWWSVCHMIMNNYEYNKMTISIYDSWELTCIEIITMYYEIMTHWLMRIEMYRNLTIIYYYTISQRHIFYGMSKMSGHQPPTPVEARAPSVHGAGAWPASPA
jgi:hypothetical protein